MFNSIKSFVLKIGKLIFAFLEYSNNKKLSDALEAKYKAEKELDIEKTNKKVEEKKEQRKENLKDIETKVENIPNDNKISKESRTIEG